ncbi:Glycosyl hydrolase catalytic core [Caballeronia arvi]|uniref:Glycosyl hydrolase catalytic core n=1 Tax=Caballeronia arvi TaxID=1777135 RepID=A0A158EQU7_9BURK|nr:glycosyl hydrolase [Caballeronia arvi]SAL09962.1 Glycosyl hydrolase catalytic core [Caballeronia arvi]
MKPINLLRLAVLVWAVAFSLNVWSQTVAQTGQIMWGINGHPQGTGSGSYVTTDIQQQLKLVADAGFKSYRIDLYSADANSMQALANVIAAAKAVGVQVLPILLPPTGSTEQESYNTGYAMGLAYARNFATDIPVWELGNEESDGMLIDPNGFGIDFSEFDRERYALVRGKLRGLLDGVNAGSPTAKRMIDGIVCEVGFFKGLWADGVKWDITAWHWYDSSGDITNSGCNGLNVIGVLHDSFHLPIWITEFGTYGTDKTAVRNTLIATMKQWNSIASQYDIQAGFIYELLDQHDEDGIQGEFGIFDSNGNGTAASDAIRGYLKRNPGAVVH